MDRSPTGRAIQCLQGSVLARADELTDGQLLELFIARRDDAAFAALVRRHGPLVLGVCQRVLGEGPDAEDAFQATFLVLVRKAATIMPRELLANWLYGVAYRTASKARAMQAKRRVKEAQVRERPAPNEQQELLWRDLLPVLDEELANLPDKYRAPIILCDLEGRSRKDAARHLGWPEGTLSSRLAQGRRRLAQRLSRRGVSRSLLPMPLAVPQTVVPVPPALLAQTVHAGVLATAGAAIVDAGVSATAAALADSVLKGMLLAKLKVAAAVASALLLLGTTAVGQRWGAHPPAPLAPQTLTAMASVAAAPSAAASQVAAPPAGPQLATASKPAPDAVANPQQPVTVHTTRIDGTRSWQVVVVAVHRTSPIADSDDHREEQVRVYWIELRPVPMPADSGASATRGGPMG